MLEQAKKALDNKLLEYHDKKVWKEIDHENLKLLIKDFNNQCGLMHMS